MLNSKTVSLQLKRIDLCNLLIATTVLKHDKEIEMRDPSTTEARREILKGSIKKWETLHNELQQQLDKFDAAHGF